MAVYNFDIKNFASIDGAVLSMSGFQVQVQTKVTAAQYLLDYLRGQIPTGKVVYVESGRDAIQGRSLNVQL